MNKYDKVIYDYQAGFQKSRRSMNEEIITMKPILEKSYESNLTVYALFIDFN